MDLSWLVRARWRPVGAWMWPAFVVLALADGFIGHALPLAGDSETVVGGLVVALIFNLVGVAVLARPVGALLRRRRPDLPAAIARNYAGVGCVALVTVAFLAIGLAHRPAIRDQAAVMHDATVRAAAYIGDHAPRPFRRDADHLDTVAIQSGSVYRSCVANPGQTEDYCVIVYEDGRPDSVVPSGSEPNETLARGTD